MTKDLYTYQAKIVSVYDGDTVTAEIDLGFHVKVTEKIRLSGIKTPELRGSERQEGLKSRNELRKWILDKELFINTQKDKQGKYGRYLGTLYLEENGELVNINKRLVDEGFAEYKDY